MSLLQKLQQVRKTDAVAMMAASETAETLAQLKAEQREAAFLALQLKQAMTHQQLKLNYQASLMMPGKRVQQLAVHLIWQTNSQTIAQAELQALAHQAAHSQALANYLLQAIAADLNELNVLGLVQKQICLQLPPQLLRQTAYLASMGQRCLNLGIKPEQIQLEFCLSPSLAQQAEVQLGLQVLAQQGLACSIKHPAPDASAQMDKPFNSMHHANVFAGLQQGLYVLQDLDFESVCSLLYEQQAEVG